jgi:hypothetical protein
MQDFCAHPVRFRCFLSFCCCRPNIIFKDIFRGEGFLVGVVGFGALVWGSDGDWRKIGQATGQGKRK